METVCLHDPCRCRTARNSAYCCDACFSADLAGGSKGGVCACGHTDCQPERCAGTQPAPEL